MWKENALLVNINYVWGMSDTAPQSFMPAWAWVSAMIVLFPIVLFAPVHWLLLKFVQAESRWRRRRGRRRRLNPSDEVGVLRHTAR